MNKNFWERVQDLEASINGGVEPLDTVTLSTSVVKTALGIYLIQSVVIALILSIMHSSMSAWLIPMSALLQVGWVWNRVTDYWKEARGFRYTRVPTDVEAQYATDSINPPTININTNTVNPRQDTQRSASTESHPLQNALDQTPLQSSELWKTADSNLSE